MDVYLLVRERGEVHFCSGYEVAGMVLQYQRHHALVGCRLTGLQAEQTHRIEVEIRHGLREVPVIVDPPGNLDDVVRISGFVRRAVQFTENSAPVPLLDYILDGSRVNSVTVHQDCADGGKRNQLRAVRKVVT